MEIGVETPAVKRFKYTLYWVTGGDYLVKAGRSARGTKSRGVTGCHGVRERAARLSAPSVDTGQVYYDLVTAAMRRPCAGALINLVRLPAWITWAYGAPLRACHGGRNAGTTCTCALATAVAVVTFLMDP